MNQYLEMLKEIINNSLELSEEERLKPTTLIYRDMSGSCDKEVFRKAMEQCNQELLKEKERSKPISAERLRNILGFNDRSGRINKDMFDKSLERYLQETSDEI
jgi:hypothetical protein